MYISRSKLNKNSKNNIIVTQSTGVVAKQKTLDLGAPKVRGGHEPL